MRIKNLELCNFRNYETLNMEFPAGCSIIYGENGQGKTNILEGIYMCSMARSHKGAKDREIIRRGFEEAHVKGEFETSLGNERIDILLRKNKGKGIAVNRLSIKKLKELYGRVSVVIFSSEDLDIIKRSPGERRKFIDLELCQNDPVYVDNLINYGKILEQRRELLKEIDRNGSNKAQLLETLDIWDMQLAGFGENIIKSRRKFIDEMNGITAAIHSEITAGKENLRIEYLPDATGGSLYDEFLKNREKDIYYKQTSAGPHRDDLAFFDGERDLKIYGSNGQQRTCAISLKLGELEMTARKKGEKPVLLLDDVLSELDRGRQTKLLKSVKDTQTIITCTGIDEFVEEEFKDAERFRVKNGTLI